MSKEKECDGKQKHTTYQSAQKELKNRPGMDIYTCRYCGRFHIGHTPARVRREK